MRYINLRFTYLLTYLPADVDHIEDCQSSSFRQDVLVSPGPSRNPSDAPPVGIHRKLIAVEFDERFFTLKPWFHVKIKLF